MESNRKESTSVAAASSNPSTSASLPSPRRTPSRPNNNVIIHSPLIGTPSNPPPTASEAGLVTHEDRWKAQSDLAGSHKQSLSLLDLSNRSLPASALKFGIPAGVASSVSDLRYDGNLVDDLPSFLDLLVVLFPKLKHISLRDNPCHPNWTSDSNKVSTRNDGMVGNGIRRNHQQSPKSQIQKPKQNDSDRELLSAANKESTRMQRLYIIYRMPDLLSIDGVTISSDERQLARPFTPAGTPVKKKDWATKTMASVSKIIMAEDGDGDDDGVGDCIDAKREGKCTGSPQSSEDEIEKSIEETPATSEAGVTTSSHVEVSMNGLVDYVRTEKGITSGMGRPITGRPITGRDLPLPSPLSKQRSIPPYSYNGRTGTSRSKMKKANSDAARQLWRKRTNEKRVHNSVESPSLLDDDKSSVADSNSSDWAGTMGKIGSMGD